MPTPDRGPGHAGAVDVPVRRRRVFGVRTGMAKRVTADAGRIGSPALNGEGPILTLKASDQRHVEDLLSSRPFLVVSKNFSIS